MSHCCCRLHRDGTLVAVLLYRLWKFYFKLESSFVTSHLQKLIIIQQIPTRNFSQVRTDCNPFCGSSIVDKDSIMHMNMLPIPMIAINVGSIPPFLRDGSFYESLDTEELHSEIDVPESCYADKDAVTNITDFAKMIKVMSFWGLHTIHLSIIEFCDCNHQEIWMNVLTDNEKLPVAQSLTIIFVPSASLEKAIELEVAEVVQYLVVKHASNLSASVAATKLGRLDYLILMHRNDNPWNESVANHLGCLQYLHENLCPWSSDLFISAATSGHLNCIQYAYEQGLQYAGYVATCGQLNILKYVVVHGGMLDRTVAYTAAKHNHQECLQYLLEVNCPVDHYTAAIAAEYGHIECLKVLHEQLGTAWWDLRITGSAAIGGQLERLQFLYDTGCPWDERTTSCAASKAKKVQVKRGAIGEWVCSVYISRRYYTRI